MDCKEVLQNTYYVLGHKGMRHLDRQTLASGLVDHSQEFQSTTVFSSVGQEVERPDVVLMLCPTTHTAILAATGKRRLRCRFLGTSIFSRFQRR